MLNINVLCVIKINTMWHFFLSCQQIKFTTAHNLLNQPTLITFLSSQSMTLTPSAAIGFSFLFSQSAAITLPAHHQKLLLSSELFLECTHDYPQREATSPQRLCPALLAMAMITVKNNNEQIWKWGDINQILKSEGAMCPLSPVEFMPQVEPCFLTFFLQSIYILK